MRTRRDDTIPSGPGAHGPTSTREPGRFGVGRAGRRKRRWSLAMPWALVAAALAGCDEGVTGPDSSPDVTFHRTITTGELEESLQSEPRRVEIRVAPDGPVVRRLEVEEAEELGEEEEIESPVTAVEASGGAGTLTLALGDLRIDFDETTRFEVEGSEGDEGVSLQQFVERVEAALAEGRRPNVEAERDPPAEPQAPDDPTFFARELELEGSDDDLEIEINVDGDNLERNDAPPPEGWITVLGLRLEIREGVTELRAKEERPEEEADFEGFVASVDVEGGSFALENGTVVRVASGPGGTEIEEADDEDELGSLQEVADALAAGMAVEADGEGIVETLDPRTLLASEVEFEIEDERDEAGDRAGVFEFEDAVTGVDLDARTFTLGSSAVVAVTEGETVIDPEGDLLTLEEVDQALADGDPVRAEGDATETSAGPPPQWSAVEVKFQVDA